jgi:indole-3-glycerol phosphate synthase
MQHKAEEVAFAKSKLALAEVKAAALDSAPCVGFVNAIESTVSSGRAAVIAEVKKASPSKGVIREDFNPVDIGKSYYEHGAACLSVLTDEHFFQGHLDYLKAIRAQVPIPILRKDFMLDEYQVYEAKQAGADCILIIAAALETSLMQDLSGLADELGLDVLVEVHNQQELEEAKTLKQRLMGVNNRNLRNFETSLQNTIGLLQYMPDDAIVVTESGIATSDDIQLMLDNKVSTFLVGEAFMRADNPGEQMANLFSF